MTSTKTIGISTVCIVVLWGVCSAGPTTRHPEDEFAELSQAEEECLKHGKFYSDITKKCHELLSTGPCADNERFVLRKRKNPQEKLILKAECKKSMCGDKKLWSETQECVSATDKEKLCGASPKVALSENHFGEGECSCIKVPPHARLNDDPDEDCYELYQRGPCSYKQILAIPVNGTTPQCIEDKCYKATLALREEDEDRRRTAVWYKDGCYELEKAGGPCPNNGTLKMRVHPGDVFPTVICDYGSGGILNSEIIIMHSRRIRELPALLELELGSIPPVGDGCKGRCSHFSLNRSIVADNPDDYDY